MRCVLICLANSHVTKATIRHFLRLFVAPTVLAVLRVSLRGRRGSNNFTLIYSSTPSLHNSKAPFVFHHLLFFLVQADITWIGLYWLNSKLLNAIENVAECRKK